MVIFHSYELWDSLPEGNIIETWHSMKHGTDLQRVLEKKWHGRDVFVR